MGEATREDDTIELAQVGLAVPHQLGVGAEQPEGVHDVVLAVGAGEDDDGRLHSISSMV